MANKQYVMFELPDSQDKGENTLRGEPLGSLGSF